MKSFDKKLFISINSNPCQQPNYSIKTQHFCCCDVFKFLFL